MAEIVIQEATLPETRLPEVDSRFAFQPNLGWAFAFCFLSLALKNGLADVFYPLLFNEDGKNLFAIYYNDHSIKNIFLFYAGYIRIFPNLTAYLLQFFPVTWIPSLYCLVSLAFTAFTYALFFSLIDRVFHHKGFALYAVLVLAALPLGSFEMVGTVMYQIWHCDIILFILAFLPLPRKPVQKTLYLLFANMLIWTHPYSILIVPWYLYKVVYHKEDRWVYGLFASSAIIYSLIGVHHHPLNWNSLMLYPASLVGRVATETVVGPFNRGMFQYWEISYIFGFLMIAFVGGTIGFAWKKMKVEEKAYYAVLAYVVLATLGVAFLGRELNLYYHLINGSPRYTYIPRITFLMMLLGVLFRHYQQSNLIRQVHWVLTALIIFSNLNSMVLYKTDVQTGQSVLDFVVYLDQNQVDCEPGAERIVYLKRGDLLNPGRLGDWSIRANLCRH